jgi:hypothetical protein
MTVGVVILRSVITCPQCGTAKTETMRTDACQFSYECTGCGIKLRPKSGDCCVFCSYGSVASPSRREEGDAAPCCSQPLGVRPFWRTHVSTAPKSSDFMKRCASRSDRAVRALRLDGPSSGRFQKSSAALSQKHGTESATEPSS